MTRKIFVLLLCSWSALAPFAATPASAQARTGSISGTVADTGNAVLPGARIKVDPGGTSTVSDSQGVFAITNVAPGSYKVTVSYVGFIPSETPVTVTSEQVSRVSAVLAVSSVADQVLVTASRAHGEAESINEERTSPNILNVLPANVITSLPNANIADAVGRLPGVTLERDEGEGKYVQIRGTEPRLSNLTIDGVNIPSPEGGVRQVKLDTIPADLIESVQIYKTLQANQDGDAIGGSVNIVTKTAGDRPTLSIYGAGGFTPIANTVPVSEFSATAGKRFGADKRLGVIFSGTYDYNGRGIDDVEATPQIQPGTDFGQGFSSLILRQYLYDRTRYGFGGSVDYKISSSNSIYVRGLFSDFKDFGRRYEYTLGDSVTPFDPANPPPSNAFTTERRLGDYQVSSLLLGGNKTFTSAFATYGLSVSRSRFGNPINGGESITAFSYIPATSVCQYDPTLAKSVFRPQFNAACYTDVYNPDNFQLASIGQANHGLAAQLNLEGSGTFGKIYSVGSHFGTLEFGVRVRNEHKFDNSFENDFAPNPGVTLLATQFLNGFKNNHYYDGSYKYGPTADWEKVNAYLRANPGQFSESSTLPPSQGGNSNNFNLVERVSAGYVQNTFDAGRFQVVAGLRIEGTQVKTLSFDSNLGTFTVKGDNGYYDLLPSASVKFALGKESDLRLVYGRGLSRPDPTFLTTATALDSSFTPPQLTIGNPALKPEHANNFDILYSRYLTPLGAFQAGFFYKQLSDPIVVLLSTPGPGQPNFGFQVVQAANSGSAYITGIEVNFQQHFTYLPGAFRGLGVSTNYSYTASQATNVNPGNRTDKPALLRQAPNTFNISPTYDAGRASLRVGLAYNGPHIFQYNFADGNPGGIRGPGGDVYTFAHLQVDAQGSYHLGRGFDAIVSALNLNNEVFGFYQGSEKFFIQREYYKPTYTFGVRWTPRAE